MNAVSKACLALLCISGLALRHAPAGEEGGVWRGVFEPRAQAVIPAEISMTVAAMPRQPGDFCREGDVLVEFDASLPRAAVEAMETKLDAAELNLSSLRNLYDRGQATPMELARAESEAAQVGLELAAARREVESCRIVAPFSGKLVEQKVREHEWASKGSPLLLLVDDSVLRVRFYLPEAQFSNIRLGDPVAVSVPAVSRRVWGEVARLGIVFDPVSRTFDAWADVVNADDSLRAGMTADVEWPAPGRAP